MKVKNSKNVFISFCEEYRLKFVFQSIPDNNKNQQDKPWTAAIRFVPNNVLWLLELHEKSLKGLITESNIAIEQSRLIKSQEIELVDFDERYIIARDGIESKQFKFSIYEEIIAMIEALLYIEDESDVQILTKNQGVPNKSFCIQVKGFENFSGEKFQAMCNMGGIGANRYEFPDHFNEMMSEPEKGKFLFDVNPKVEIPKIDTPISSGVTFMENPDLFLSELAMVIDFIMDTNPEAQECNIEEFRQLLLEASDVCEPIVIDFLSTLHTRESEPHYSIIKQQNMLKIILIEQVRKNVIFEIEHKKQSEKNNRVDRIIERKLWGIIDY